MNAAKFLSTVTPGFSVKTQISSLNTWIPNTVLSTDKECMVIPFVDEYLRSTLLPNDVIKCRFGIGENEITLGCIVKDILFISPPTMLVKVLKVDVWKNMRASERFDVNYFCKAVTEEKFAFLSVVTNFSDTGAAFVCKDQIRTGSDIMLSVMTHEGITLDVYANIVRNRKTLDNKIEYGVRFINLTEEEKTKIEIVFESLRDQEREKIEKLHMKYRLSAKAFKHTSF